MARRALYVKGKLIIGAPHLLAKRSVQHNTSKASFSNKGSQWANR
jgi:hypothetical protein